MKSNLQSSIFSKHWYRVFPETLELVKYETEQTNQSNIFDGSINHEND